MNNYLSTAIKTFVCIFCIVFSCDTDLVLKTQITF